MKQMDRPIWLTIKNFFFFNIIYIVQPGHEYTKANVKFCLTVSQSDPIKKLQIFAENNRQTQGKFTIGDEKVCIPHAFSLCPLKCDYDYCQLELCTD